MIEMLYVQTSIKIVDNSGGGVALCIRILRSQTKVARAGDVIVLSVKTIIHNRKLKIPRKKKVLKGHVYRAIVIRTSVPTRRFGNVYLRAEGNAVAMLGKWDMPLANRATGPAMLELKKTKFAKFTNITEGII